jgi:hypothetical protein
MIDRAILAYLIDHVDAVDTWEGIRRWWIPGQPSEEEIRRALDELVRSRWLTVSIRGDSTLLYALNKERLSELRVHLNG